MKLTKMWMTVSITAVLAIPTLAPAQRSPEVTLRAAMETETVKGDLKSAIEQYKKVAQSGNRAVAAQALLRMAECYQKLGDAESRKVYERIVRDYGDQPAAVAAAKAHLGGDAVAKAEPANRRVWTLPEGGEITSLISRDGRYIPYIGWAGAQSGNLFLHDLVTGTDRQLTDTATDGKPGAPIEEFAENPAISRDGTKLAYAWYRSDHDRGELRMIDLTPNGIPQFRIVFDSADIEWVSPHDWSPDGKWIALELSRKDQTKSIGLVNVSDGTLRILKSTEWRGSNRTVFSPDGKFLAFDLPSRDDTENRDIFAITVDGSREIPLVTHPSHDTLLGWTSDGKRLIFASDRSGSMGIWAQPISDGRPQGAPELLKREIGSSWQSMGLTDSGTLFSVTGNKDAVFNIRSASIDVNTGKLTSPPEDAVATFVGSNRMPVWSPDGKYLAYQSLRASVGMHRYVIGIRSTDTGAIREIEPLPNFVEIRSLEWNPDGKSLIVTGYGRKGLGVSQVDLQTGKSRTLAENSLYVGLMGAGGSKLYLMNQGYAPGGSDFYRALIEKDLASGKERELVRGADVNNIRMSPDGKWITVGVPSTIEARRAQRTPEILAFPTSGGEPRVLLKADGAQAVRVISWMPDSRSLQIVKVLSSQSLERWLVPVDGGTPTNLGTIQPKDFFGRIFSLHPDGKRIAFEVRSPTKPQEVWILENFLPKSGISGLGQL